MTKARSHTRTRRRVKAQVLKRLAQRTPATRKHSARRAAQQLRHAREVAGTERAFRALDEQRGRR